MDVKKDSEKKSEEENIGQGQRQLVERLALLALRFLQQQQHKSSPAVIEESQNWPITGVVIVADAVKCPPGFSIIDKTYDSYEEADLWREEVFGRQVTRFLCVKKSEPQLSKDVLVDVAIIRDTDQKPADFTVVELTHDTREKAMKHQHLCIRWMSCTLTNDAISEIIFLSKGAKTPPLYTLVGKLSDLVLCYRKTTIKVPQNTQSTNLNISRHQEHPKLLHGQGERKSVFSKTKKLTVSCPNYPRYGQIITMTIDEMKSYIGDRIGNEIGSGGFGTVYKAKMPDEDNLMFAIKEIKTEKEHFQKSYDREIHHGRILHPFINPIVARAESLKEGISYLMYPYMMNSDLRLNIDSVNKGNDLCSKESNEKIWIRCIYQIVQAVDFLHKPVASVRASIFHRDLTSHNILLDENFNVRIGDFGIAVEAKWNATKVTVTKALGTQGYHPPNMSQEKFNASYDVFSVGVVMLEILTGEEAVLQKKPHYLYEKYNYEGGDEDLTDVLNVRSEENKAASWSKISYRNKFAKIALQAVQLNEIQRKMVDLLKELEDLRLDSKERYKIPENQDRCVSCYVNPKAKLSTKGQECIGKECKHFCVHCLKNHHFNPLVCPTHGKTRPPFGDHVYAVFLAGNCVKNEQYPGGKGPCHDTKIAKMFVDDVQKVVQVLTAKHPFVLGASKENIRVVKPEKPGTEDKMETKLKQSFEDLSAAIKQAIKNENLDPEKVRLHNSLFIFYFSGHCSQDRGLNLGSTGETLKASADWIQEMLNKKLGVDQILVVLDCCHANSQNFTDSHGLDAVDGRGKASIVQLSSCDTNETSSGTFEGGGHGSYFTHYFCQGLLGLDSASLEDDTVKFCNECEKRRQAPNAVDIILPCGMYHTQCLSDEGVTCYALKNYIQGHQKLMGMTPVYDTQGEKEKIYLAYYNRFKWHIPIHLKGSEESKLLSLNSDINSMDKLRQSVEEVFPSFVREFHETYVSAGKDSCPLIAVHPRYGSNREELTDLDSIYKAWSCSLELEARVRDNVEAISNGPVKWRQISPTLVLNSGLEGIGHLEICQNYIQIMIDSIMDVKRYLRDMLLKQNMQEDLKSLIKDILELLRSKRNFEEEKEKVLRIYLYKEFSILALEPFIIGNS